MLLENRIEIISLEKCLEDNRRYNSVGSLVNPSKESSYHQICWVENAEPFISQEVLVRLLPKTLRRHLNSRKDVYWGAFITSKVPENFQSLDTSEVIFYGLWEEYMQKQTKIPTLDEVNKYYDPQHMRNFLYIHKKDTGRKDIYQAGYSRNSKEFYVTKMSYGHGFGHFLSHAIKDLISKPPIMSRVLILEPSIEIEPVIKKILEHNQVPIQMEPVLRR